MGISYPEQSVFATFTNQTKSDGYIKFIQFPPSKFDTEHDLNMIKKTIINIGKTFGPEEGVRRLFHSKVHKQVLHFVMRKEAN